MNTSKKDAEMAYEDHDFPLASKHYFHGSVYQVMDNKKDYPKASALKDIDNSIFTRRGAHYVAIRSSYHCSSTSGTHAYDVMSIIENRAFKTSQGEADPFIEKEGDLLATEDVFGSGENKFVLLYLLVCVWFRLLVNEIICFI